MNSISPVPANVGDEDIDMRCRAHQLCSEHLGGAWTRISPREMSLEPISGGMSNQLFRCSLPESTILTNGEPSQILLRIYGDQSRNCDMSIQLEIFSLLSSRELGPKLYGNFDDGRLEEFLPATSLTSEELMDSEISSIIAKKIATVHSLDVPIDRNSTWLTERLDEWSEFLVNLGGAIRFADGLSQSTKEIARKLLAIDFVREIKFLRGILAGTRSPIVFSHNDLHQGNILLAKYSKRRPTLEERIVLIDFEYCSYNYRAYDIANHFCEWCFEYDTLDYPHFEFYEDRFPSKSAQRNFIKNYVDQRRKLKSLSRRNSQPLSRNGLIINNKSDDNRIGGIGGCGDKSSVNGRCDFNCSTTSNGTNNNNKLDREEDIILDEIKPFLMAANLLWTLWCIKSAHSSTIKFGYWEHAMARWKMYSSFKSLYSEEIAEKENGRLLADLRSFADGQTTFGDSSSRGG